MRSLFARILQRGVKTNNNRPPHQNKVRLNLEAFEERAMPGSMLTSAEWLAPLSWTGGSGGSSGLVPTTGGSVHFLPSATPFTTPIGPTLPPSGTGGSPGEGSNPPVALVPPTEPVGTPPVIELPFPETEAPSLAPSEPPASFAEPEIAMPSSPTDVTGLIGPGQPPPEGENGGGEPNNGEVPPPPQPTVQESGAIFHRSVVVGASGGNSFSLSVTAIHSFSLGSPTQADTSDVIIVATGNYAGEGGPISFTTTFVSDEGPESIPENYSVVPLDDRAAWTARVENVDWNAMGIGESASALVRGSVSLAGQTTYFGINAASFGTAQFTYSSVAGAIEGERTESLIASGSGRYRSEFVLSDSQAAIPSLPPVVALQADPNAPDTGHALTGVLAAPADIGTVPTGAKWYQREFASGSSSSSQSITRQLAGENVVSAELHSTDVYDDLARSRYYVNDAVKAGNRNATVDPSEVVLGFKFDSDLQATSDGGWSADFTFTPDATDPQMMEIDGSLVATSGVDFTVLKDTSEVTLGYFFGGTSTLTGASSSFFDGSVGGGTGFSSRATRNLA